MFATDPTNNKNKGKAFTLAKKKLYFSYLLRLKISDIDSRCIFKQFHDLTEGRIVLPPTTRELLGSGLNFIPTPKLCKQTYIDQRISAINELENKLRIQFEFQYSSKRSNLPKQLIVNRNYRSTFRLHNKITQWFKDARNSVLPFYKSRDNLSFELSQTLSYLKGLDNIIITETDKNLGPCILMKDSYIKLALVHLEDTQRYKEVFNYDIQILKDKVSLFVKKYERSVNASIRSMFKTVCFELESTTFPTFKIFPKIHKINEKGEWNHATRPITSCINSPTYFLSKFLDVFLEPLLVDFPQVLGSSDDLLSEVRRLNLSHLAVASMDASALYPSIPIEPCIHERE